MSQKSREFRIVTTWLVEGSIEEVADILADPERFPDWWGDVYLGVRMLDRGAADGIGARVAVHSKGWLPYHLNWTATVTASRRPHGWTVVAEGDLTGHGVWTLRQKGPLAEAVYDWRVSADRPVLRLLSPILAPVFAWNHRWAMARGESGLRDELIRRRLGAQALYHRGSGTDSSRARSAR